METPTQLGLHPELNPTLQTVRLIPIHLAKRFYGCGYHENYRARVEWGRTHFVAWVCCTFYLTQLLEIHLSTQRLSSFEGGRTEVRKKESNEQVQTLHVSTCTCLPARRGVKLE